ncbi:MAG: hypothetical protein ABIQ87_08345 [Rubrivivax sp.]
MRLAVVEPRPERTNGSLWRPDALAVQVDQVEVELGEQVEHLPARSLLRVGQRDKAGLQAGEQGR